MPNNDLICKICGQCCHGESTITLKGGYGSIHDGEVTHFLICGECFDRIYAKVVTDNALSRL